MNDAHLHSQDGATLFVRELAKEFASTDGIRFIVERGPGETTVAQDDFRLTIDAELLEHRGVGQDRWLVT